MIEIPTLWADPDLGGEDGKRGLAWLVGTEVEAELEKKHDSGLSLVCLPKLCLASTPYSDKAEQI